MGDRHCFGILRVCVFPCAMCTFKKVPHSFYYYPPRACILNLIQKHLSHISQFLYHFSEHRGDLTTATMCLPMGSFTLVPTRFVLPSIFIDFDLQHGCQFGEFKNQVHHYRMASQNSLGYTCTLGPRVNRTSLGQIPN